MKEFRLLNADEIECRIASIKEKGITLLLYKDARVDQNILDETVGPMNWQRTHEVINGNLFCNVGIYYPDIKEWVWKQDVGTESYTEKEKGQASDSFKRACFNWGIGRELYTAPFIWINADSANISDGKCYDKFKVLDISYEDRKIKSLVITNESKKGIVVYRMGKNNQKLSEAKINILKNDVKDGVIDEPALFKHFGVKKYEDIIEDQFTKYITTKKVKS